MTEHRSERDAFIAVAGEFCELYEDATRRSADAFLLALARTLPRLHAAGVALPFPDDEEDIPEDDLDLRLTLEERQAIDFPVSDLLGGLEWRELEKHFDDARMSSLSLYDDLSDIHADLKEGFLLLEAGRPEAEAVFGWRLSFWSHWGYHSASALRLVHNYVALYIAG
jgi:hypothetical protein